MFCFGPSHTQVISSKLSYKFLPLENFFLPQYIEYFHILVPPSNLWNLYPQRNLSSTGKIDVPTFQFEIHPSSLDSEFNFYRTPEVSPGFPSKQKSPPPRPQDTFSFWVPKFLQILNKV